MPPFPKPKFQYTYNLANEINHLRQHKQTRAIPARAQNRLLIATWNIANFGVHGGFDSLAERFIFFANMDWRAEVWLVAR